MALEAYIIVHEPRSAILSSWTLFERKAHKHAFGAAIYQWLQTLRVLRIDEIHQRSIDPASRFNRI
jgi:hypothetical protein